ncbi:hypothetical protein [Desulfosporosinus metallidurans]|uniref:Uncharacterized protein n=1 Tax=Desulfosporosinus metallidurans TaxID=1888891 RepID=A0A1Q8QRW6_9FIRM|nr:hypothetical protein [Desulfosporosinus metallidurans]OLN30089.1 hypothetical protein DSOL_3221 [Desulfosporosinus metallidurans]
MKRILSIFIMLALSLTILFPLTAYAVGEGNIDSGGGGMGSGTNENYWNTGDEGVRVTVVRASDHAVVTTPVDFTNKSPDNIQAHFGKVSKISYTNGFSLTPNAQTYTYVNPSKVLPRIISSGSGNANIEAIKSYFTDELIVRYISSITGFNYDTLINGDYKILLEPIAYMTFQGVRIAVTATEAALYDQQLGGGLRSKMVSLSHKNLPLAMFLETPDLGYPAWSGSTTSSASNADIISSLGLGIVRFSEAEPPVVSSHSYTYRVNTEVITSVTVSGGQSDPDHPVTVRFTIGGRTYTVGNVYYPDGDSQLVWVRWTTPSTPQTMTINVSVTGSGRASQGTITANIVDLSGNDPPNPVADDRNDSYSRPSVPNNPQKTSSSWGIWSARWHAYWVWVSDWNWYSDVDEGGHWEDDGSWEDHGWWDFGWNSYSASLSASMSIVPDAKAPTASGKTMKSGYGVNQTTTANVSTNQSSAVTGAQTAVTYFPEFRYQTYWRLLERTSSGYNAKFEFAKNKYSTYNRRTHFTPIWMSDGSYTPYTYLIDCWTPSGMLSINLTDSVTISGNLWSDWHIAPVKP